MSAPVRDDSQAGPTATQPGAAVPDFRGVPPGHSRTGGPPGTAPVLDADPARWRMLALLAAAELLGMSLWFAASAVAPQLAAVWGLDTSQAAWLTTVVQLGFVAGTASAAVLNLADIVAARTLFAACATLGALANGALLLAPGSRTALACRFATGFFLAGVYPPAMKMVATWFRARRGLAIGTVVGALTVGKATPYLVHALRGAGIAAVVLSASAGAALAALLIAAGYRDGPYPFPPRPFSWGLVAEVARLRRFRLATGGYLGHMFELYSFWTWIPVFLAASAARHGGTSSEAVSLAAFGTIAVGGAGCIWGGLVADRTGRERLVILALAASGSCALAIGALFGASLWAVTLLAWVWGFFVIADSAQFSALVTEAVPPHAVGTALTVQTSLGFLLTTLSIQLLPPIAARLGWRWAFPILALGPACGIAAIRRLAALRPRPA
ncbi:MAG TPA: MFS transporter [Thermoanaerobaculia bacterium]|nr:MFS transporter [Thermoanaerobaculia bacterium]